MELAVQVEKRRVGARLQHQIRRRQHRGQPESVCKRHQRRPRRRLDGGPGLRVQRLLRHIAFFIVRQRRGELGHGRRRDGRQPGSGGDQTAVHGGGGGEASVHGFREGGGTGGALDKWTLGKSRGPGGLRLQRGRARGLLALAHAMAVLSLPLSFTNSFWSQDYRRGLDVLYNKLEQVRARYPSFLAP